MSSKSTTANELRGIKNVLGGIVQMTIIKGNLSLWWRSVSQRLQEGMLGGRGCEVHLQMLGQGML